MHEGADAEPPSAARVTRLSLCEKAKIVQFRHNGLSNVVRSTALQFVPLVGFGERQVEDELKNLDYGRLLLFISETITKLVGTVLPLLIVCTPDVMIDDVVDLRSRLLENEREAFRRQ